ncbi:MAG: hypothetical protein KQH79_12900 [Bacteroidetes bacterium]|nr:hypothetical protein [Bacteroidota bacterium]
MIIHKRVPAGALYYAVFIALLISVLSGLLLAYTYIHNSYINRQILQEQAISNVKSGINLVLKNPELLSYGDYEEVKLFGNDYDLVKLRKEHWGAYDLIYSNSKRQSYKASKIALIGDHLGKKEDIALYLTDKKKYLSISGNTLLKGTCYLPKLGIKRAYIEGQGYQNRELVYGKVLQSEAKLPALNTEKIKNIESLVTKQLTKEDSLVEITSNVSSELINNSFYNKTLILYSDQITNLSGMRLEGNIILKFDQDLTIPENCSLKDVIIIAPSVRITDGFKGSVQILATDKVLVGNSCQLKYPSFLVVLKDKEDEDFSMVIGQNTTVAGGILLYSESSSTKNPYKIKLEELSKIYGTVYCNGYAEHRGSIYGSLYCEGFTLKTAASLYENHLLNVIIDHSKLPQEFVGINLVEKPVNEQIINWLN